MRGRKRNTASNDPFIQSAIEQFRVHLRALREGHDLTRLELSRRANIALSTLEYYEYGHTKPSFEALLALCKTFEISPNELLCWERLSSLIKAAS